MLKRPISYVDYNGQNVTDIYYFNLTKAELIEMEFGIDGGFGEMMQRIIDTRDVSSIVSEFKRLILFSYGVKSDDGKRFIKSDQLREEFSQTAAYDALFMEIAGDANVASTFILGIMPSDLSTSAEMEMKQAEIAKRSALPSDAMPGLQPPPPPQPVEPRTDLPPLAPEYPSV